MTLTEVPKNRNYYWARFIFGSNDTVWFPVFIHSFDNVQLLGTTGFLSFENFVFGERLIPPTGETLGEHYLRKMRDTHNGC